MKKTKSGNKKSGLSKNTKQLLIFALMMFVCIYHMVVYGVSVDMIYVLILMSCILIGVLVGTLAGIKEKNKIKAKNIDNSLYLRELPNNFGIGVTTLLFDSTIENNKDIVAVILDLCARKYLKLIKANNKYNVIILRGIDNQLLDNEKYVMELIMQNNIKGIDYNKWYRYCENDGTILGLYYRPENNNNNDNNSSEFFSESDKVNGIFDAFKTYKNKYYNIVMSNSLIRTQKGEEEYQKLVSFRNFIKDFGAFAGREAKEVVIWDRYLSYAQVFGLTNEIMKTGYKELIDNASFKIDDINNITLDNIEILL